MKAEKLRNEADSKFAQFYADSLAAGSAYYRLSLSDQKERERDTNDLVEAIPRLREKCEDLTKKAKVLFVAYRKQGSRTFNVNYIEAARGDERRISALRVAICVWDCVWNVEDCLKALLCLGGSNKAALEHFARRASMSHLRFNRIRMLLFSNAQEYKESIEIK